MKSDTETPQAETNATRGDGSRSNDPVVSLGTVVERAAAHLPDGYTIHILIEKGGYGVELEFPNTQRESMDGGDGIISDVNQAIAEANGFYG